jgi:glycosyltransferase involved in cell wall biosynthesis
LARQRILFAIQTYPDSGGISSNLENYVLELGEEFEIHVAIVDERDGRRERMPLPDSQVHIAGYTNAINALLTPTSQLFAIKVGHFLRNLVRELSPRAVIVQDGLNLPVPGLLATWRNGSKLVVMDHGTLTNVHEREWLRMVTRRLGWPKGLVFWLGFHADAPWRAIRWRLGVKLADALWYTGDELRPWFAAAGERTREYSQTVPSDFTPATAEERLAARKALELPEEVTVLNVVGRVDGEKGVEAIVAALATLKAERQDWLTIFVGDGSLDAWVRAEVRRTGLERNVRFLGRLGRDGVRRVQHASDFHVYAGTISCGVSVCLLEAMAAGVIPIASDVPSLQRKLVEGTGWWFPAGNVEALEQVLLRALSETPAERDARRAATLDRIAHSPRPTIPDLLTQLLG